MALNVSVAFILVFILFNVDFTSQFHLTHRLPSVTSQTSGLPTAKWFTQRLDHFNNADNRTWQQRYFTNDSYYVPGGPAFVNIGGEGPADPIWSVTGQWINWAKLFNATCFQLEHRYYGESHPTADASVKNLQYLSSEQALADLATFRSAMAEKYGLQDAKWIFFGGSYSGSLAAWMRLKYPHLVDGAVASSAPVQAQINFKEYLEVVDKSLKEVSNTCTTAITAAINQMDALLAQGELGWDIITTKFRLCSSLNGSKSLDVTSLFSELSDNIQDIVQYNKDRREFEGVLTSNITIEMICGIMDDITIGSEIDRYAAVNSLLLNTLNEHCLSYEYDEMINDLRSSSWNSSSVKEGMRQWIYQTCTEFGYYQSSDLTDQPFGQKFGISFFVDQCAHIFGPKFSSRLLELGVNQTNIIYGGKKIRVSNVIFSNGSVDPWHYLGILKDISSAAKAILINGTAHCADTYPSSPLDPPQLIQARQIIQQHIATWIS